MEIIIKRDKNIPNKVTTNMIHGKFPYKKYLQMMGNSLYGEYIAIIDNKPICNNLDTIAIQLNDKISFKTQSQMRSQAQGLRPNTVDETVARYKVKEVNVLDIGRVPIMVFRPVRDTN